MRPIPLLLALSLAACNRYEFFNVAGYEQATFSNEADILFIIDNSASMAEEATALALNFNTFIDQLTSASGGTPVTEDLSDAVTNYANYVTDRTRFIDYQIGITTTTVDYDSEGATAGVDPGEAGLLIGSVLTKDATDIDTQFREQLLCEATCWQDVDSNPGYVCGTDPGDVITEEYLDCLCGPGAWEDHCGAGTEEHLEAMYDALCRAAPEPPDACFNDTETGNSLSPISSSDAYTNPGLLRDDATTVVVFITDEGDTSRRLEQGVSEPTVYLDGVEEFDRNLRVAAIGPGYDPDSTEFPCNSGGATTWGTERIIIMTEETQGFYNYISEESGSDCVDTDFAVHLNDLGDLLSTLLNVFRLNSVPDEASIRVYVNDEEIAASDAEEDVETGEITYGDGWSYDPGMNAVVFWGEAVPDYNADVRIFYRPLEGKPRELPF